MRIGIRQPREDVPPVGHDRDEARHRLAALDRLRREPRPAPLVLELVEVVLAVAAVPVELRKRGRVHRLVVRHEDAVVPLAAVLVLCELEDLLAGYLLRLRAFGCRQRLLFEGNAWMSLDHGPADEDESPRELPGAQLQVMFVRLPSAAAGLPLVVVGKVREELLRHPHALDLEEIGQSPRLDFGHDVVVSVADVPSQEERPPVRRDCVEERPEPGHTARTSMLLAGEHVDAQRDAGSADEERVVVVARTPGLLGIIAEFRSFLMSEDRFDGVVDVDDVSEAEHRIHGLVFMSRKPVVERLVVGLAQGTPDGVLRDDPFQSEQLHRSGVISERVDLHVPVLAEQDRKDHRPDDVAFRARVVAPVVDGEVRAEPVEESGRLEEHREVGEASRRGDFRARVPSDGQAATVGGDVDLRVLRDFEFWHFTPERCCGTIHGVVFPLVVLVVNNSIITEIGTPRLLSQER